MFSHVLFFFFLITEPLMPQDSIIIVLDITLCTFLLFHIEMTDIKTKMLVIVNGSKTIIALNPKISLTFIMLKGLTKILMGAIGIHNNLKLFCN